MSDAEIPLADVIRQLRKEMLTAVEAGQGEGLRAVSSRTDGAA